MAMIKFYSLTISLFLYMLVLVSCEKNLDTYTEKNLDKSSNSVGAAAFLSPYIVGFGPNPVVSGDSTKVLVKLSSSAPRGGIVVTLNKVRSAGPVVDLPQTLFIPAGEISGTAFIHTIPFKDSIFESIYATLPSFVSSEPALLLIVPRSKSDTRPPLQIFEAENAFLLNVMAKKADVNSQVFFSNGAFAQFSDAKRSYVRFDVMPVKPGEHILEFRYAWRTSVTQQPQPLVIRVNTTDYSLLFPPTANDNNNNLVYLRVNLKAGNNSIYAGTNTGNVKGLRLDNLTVAVP